MWELLHKSQQIFQLPQYLYQFGMGSSLSSGLTWWSSAAFPAIKFPPVVYFAENVWFWPWYEEDFSVIVTRENLRIYRLPPHIYETTHTSHLVALPHGTTFTACVWVVLPIPSTQTFNKSRTILRVLHHSPLKSTPASSTSTHTTTWTLLFLFFCLPL